MHTSIGPQRCSCAPLIKHSGSLVSINRPPTALHATAAPSRYAAEETARKAAAVREQLKHQSSRYAKQIHDQNAHIAELQQQASRRAQQQAELSKLLASEEVAVQQEQQWAQDDAIHEQLHHQLIEHVNEPLQQQSTLLFADSDQQSRSAPQHGGGSRQQRHFQETLQDPQQQHQPQRQQEGFPKLLQEVEVLARSSDCRDWHNAAVQCRCVLVPAVSGPLQAAAAWRLMVGLAGRQLSRHSQRTLGAAAAALVQVSLAHNDVSMLERLLDSSTRFSLGPRQLRDLASVAAAAGADTDMLTALLDLSPASQLCSRAYFVVALTCLNRRHYQEAAACLARLQDRGVGLSPALARLQQTARGALKAKTAAAAAR